MSIESSEDVPILIENFNPKNYFNDSDLKKINNNEKLLITNIAKYSITKPIHTSWIKSIIINFFKKLNLNTKNLNIIDCTACVGGDTISFTKYFKNVLSIEKNKIHYNILTHNIDILKINNIKTINDDFVSSINNNNLHINYDMLFVDPPWGGPNYKNMDNIDLFITDDNNNKIFIKDIINSYYDKFKFIILKSPTNLNLNKKDYLYNKIHTFKDKDNKILLIIFEK